VARTLNSNNDNVVLLGDSLMKQGLYPEALTAELKTINPRVRVTNLATSGGTQNIAISYLEYLRTRKHIKPKVVVYDFEVMMTGYGTGERDFDFHTNQSYLFNSILRKPKTLSEIVAASPSRCSYLIRQRGNIKHFVLDFLNLVTRPKAFQDNAFFTLHDVSDFESSGDGMSPHYRVASDVDLAEQEKRMNSNYDHSPRSSHFVYNSNAYSVITTYCQQHQIPLILLWLPHETSVYRAFWYKAPYTESWFKKRFAEYANEPFVFPVDLNILPERNSYFSDYHHLNNLGCVAASEKFAEVLKGPLCKLVVPSSSEISQGAEK
jgi:hypothetical protein